MSAAKLPEDRPLWDYTVIKGLQDGAVAHLSASTTSSSTVGRWGCCTTCSPTTRRAR